MDNSTFDQWLREKMSRLEDVVPPADWGRMEDRLNEEAWIDNQNEQAADFDQAIRQSLANTPGGLSADWEKMSQKLDQEFGPENLDDILLDGVVYEQLHHYQAPYNAQHWPIMEERLEETYSIRRKLVKYKVAEVSLMLLLIFTLLQFLPFYTAQQKRAAAEQPQPLMSDLSALSAPTATDLIDESSMIKSAYPSSAYATNSNTAKTTNGSQSIAGPDADQSSSLLPPNSTVDLATGAPSSAENQMVIAPVDLISAHPMAIDLTDQEIKAANDLLLETIANEPANLITPFDMLAILAAQQLDTPDKVLPDCLFCPKTRRQKSWQIGMVVATDLNYIHPTEAEFRFRLPDYDEMNMGYGGGLTITVPITKRWAFETGLIYASAYYLPDEINAPLQGSFIGGFSAVGFQSAQLHMLKIPIQAQYAFNPNNNRWRWYGIMGASVNATMIQEYYFRTIPEPTFLGNPSTPRSGNLAAQLSEEHQGLLDKGQLDDNLQVTANIGVGLERFFSPRWSIFVQPVYQHDLRLQSLQGFGPYQDRINSLSFYFGSKVTLK